MNNVDNIKDRNKRNSYWVILAIIITSIYIILCMFYGDAKTEAVRFPDTNAFIAAAAGSNVKDVSFYTTARPFTGLILHKLFPGNLNAIMLAQIWVSAGSWIILGAALALLYRERIVSVVVYLLVLSLSLAWPIYSWNFVILSESLSFSFMACSVGLTLLMLNPRLLSFGYIGIGVWAPAILLWCGTRDTVVYSLVTLGGLLLSLLVFDGRRRVNSNFNKSRLVVMLGSLLIVVAMCNWCSERSGRWKTPVLNVLLLRILPDSQNYHEWVEVYGLPDSGKFRSFIGKYAWDLCEDKHEIREYLLESAKSGDELNGFQDWYKNEGLKSMRRFLLSHPLWTIRIAGQAYLELLPTRADVYLVDAPKPNVARMFTSVFFPKWNGGMYISSAALVTLLSVILYRRLHRRGALICLGMALTNSFIQMTISFHGDYAEPERHTFLAGILFRLSIVVGIGLILDSLFCMRGSRETGVIGGEIQK